MVTLRSSLFISISQEMKASQLLHLLSLVQTTYAEQEEDFDWLVSWWLGTCLKKGHKYDANFSKKK